VCVIVLYCATYSMFEKRHTRISINSTVLHDISSYHPFTQQVGEYSFFFTGEDPWSLSLTHTHTDRRHLSVSMSWTWKRIICAPNVFCEGWSRLSQHVRCWFRICASVWYIILWRHPRYTEAGIFPLCPAPPPPPQKNKALGEILTISCLVSLASELHDHWNCLIKTASRGSFLVVIFFFGLLPFWKYDPVQEWPRCSESEPRLWHAQRRCLVRRYTRSVDDVCL